MVENLIIAAAWVIIAGFLLKLNTLIRQSAVAKRLTWWSMWLSIVIAAGFVVVTSLEVLRG